MRLLAVILAGGMAASGGAAAPAPAYTPPPGSPLALKEHPRIWVTRAGLPSLRAKVGPGGEFHGEFKQWVEYLDGVYDTAAEDSEAALHSHAMNFSYLHLLGPIRSVTYRHAPAEYASKGKQLLLKIPVVSSALTIDSFGAAVAYDWLHPVLSAAERKAVVDYLKAADPLTPLTTDRNPFNASDIGGRTAHIMGGLAFWGDGIDDAAADAALNACSTLILGPHGVLDSSTFWAGKEGSWAQGFSYGTYSLPWMLYGLEAWRTANGLDLAKMYGGAAAMRYFPSYLSYLILPHAAPKPALPGGRDWILLRGMATSSGTGPADYASPCFISAAVRGIYASVDPDMAGLSQWLIDTRVGDIPVDGHHGLHYALLGTFILGDKVAARSPADLKLPLTRRMKDVDVMRTGWDLTDSMVTFGATPFAAFPGMFHQVGSFTLDRKGPLIIHAGTILRDGYEGSPFSRNLMAFVDPTLPRPTHEFDDLGGPRRFVDQLGTGHGVLTENGYFDAIEGPVKHQNFDPRAGRDFDYYGVNLGRVYNGTLALDAQQTPKVDSYTRQFVYFRPRVPGVDSDRLVVFDRVRTLDARFEKRWHLHTSGNPAVNGTAIADTPVRGGSGIGRTTYENADEIIDSNTLDGTDGKLFIKVLLPASRKVVKIDRYEDTYGVPIADWEPPPNRQAYAGKGRIEVIPSRPGLYDTFLHVIEAADARGTKSPAALLSGLDLVGARVGNRIAAFHGKEGVFSSGTLVIDVPGAYKVLVCDLIPGAAYTLSHGDSRTSLPASGAGTLTVDVTIGAPKTTLTLRKS